MDYREVEAPRAMQGIVKLGWSLTVPDDGPAWVRHVATPDGCMEIIRRLRGHSRWGGEQPECFVAGVITSPQQLELSAGSAFVAVRIRPWASRLLGPVAPRELNDHWAALDQFAPGLTLPDTPEAAIAALGTIEATPAMIDMAAAIETERTPGALTRRVGLSPRALQRWFARNVGQAPSTYLRLVRFSQAFAALDGTDHRLAGHAADHGFADQAHMAREFRSLAGEPASRARQRAHGPFLDSAE